MLFFFCYYVYITISLSLFLLCKVNKFIVYIYIDIYSFLKVYIYQFSYIQYTVYGIKCVFIYYALVIYSLHYINSSPYIGACIPVCNVRGITSAEGPEGRRAGGPEAHVHVSSFISCFLLCYFFVGHTGHTRDTASRCC